MPPTTMTAASTVGTDFDFAENDIRILPDGAILEFVYWHLPELPVKLGSITIVNGGASGTIGGESIEEPLWEFAPQAGALIKTQLSLDGGANWIQVNTVDVFNHTQMYWSPNYFWAIKRVRRELNQA